ncbi:JDVT-CTERM system glutamic-type intramembrane protease MrtJ [Trichlorobacter ammonificans]|uniref:CAAX prenyl protease 2/Lysostaphin resistance protein A-like domain-containing protein n=1 Tax=Trichlorobacter ammonificans TaxID=2916410 RepID=A0ABM9DA74_9BACT|nr:JDVT-CTERM system glutamic-type intramembrane protease [Trichlorobacter ammonificans]CAH2032117.1 membrane protein of unknown function [Trichlorobacter ammonificans]
MKQQYETALLFLAAVPVAAVALHAGLVPRFSPVPLWYLLIAAPLWEELFFRGVIQRRLHETSRGSRHIAGLSTANWLTSLLFMMAHLPFHGISAAATLAPSLALGRQFEQYRHLVPCILLHGWFNLSWLLLARS